MRRIKSACLQFFRNAAHCGFMTRLRDLLEEFPRAREVAGALHGEFIALLAREEALYDVMRKSWYTGKIVEANKQVDRVLVGMREMIEAALHHYDPAIARAARRLHDRFAAFGYITRKTYMGKVAVIHLLVADLYDEEYAGAVALTGLSPWLDRLRDDKVALERLFEERVEEAARKPPGQLREMRYEMDRLYHQVTRRLAAADLLDDGGALSAFIARLNVEIDYFNRYNGHRLPRDISAGANCVVEPLGTLPRTGKAVTPVPVAYYRDGKEGALVELVFARDFSVTYRNNVKPGTADVTLRGKGRYKGLVTVTFNIEE